MFIPKQWYIDMASLFLEYIKSNLKNLVSQVFFVKLKRMAEMIISESLLAQHSSIFKLESSPGVTPIYKFRPIFCKWALHQEGNSSMLQSP